MNKIFLTKSKYCKGVQCPKILWMDKFKHDILDEDKDESAYEEGRKVGELAKGLFGDYVDVPYNENPTVRMENTEKLLQDQPNVITEASFIYDNNFCSVDILKNDSDGVKIYEVKSTSNLEKRYDIYIHDVAYQYFVLSNLGLNVKRASIVYLNKEYRRHGELDITQLFKIRDVTEEVVSKQDEVKGIAAMIKEFMEAHNEDTEPENDIGPYCFGPYECSFWEYCTRDLPKPNVFDISGMWTSKKFEKYYEGKISFEDLQNENLNKKYLEQIDYELNDRGTKIEKEAINEFLDSLTYPLYFIDYESCKYAIPKYEGTTPYQQIPFQYSLHIIQEEGAPIEHKEFIADFDDENIIF